MIVNPVTDPHAYVPTAADSRLLAESRMAIVNGIGYDQWARQGLAATTPAGRARRRARPGLGTGASPHQWYAPASVGRIADAITADYTRLDPAGAAYYAERRRAS